MIKHSGVGVDDEWLESEVLKLGSSRTRVAFWDVDAPATLARVEGDARDAFRPLIGQYDFIFTYGGGPPIVNHYMRMGAKNCHPVYNAHDPSTHHPVPASENLICDLAFVGNRLPDREVRVEQFFLEAANLASLSPLLGLHSTSASLSGRPYTSSSPQAVGTLTAPVVPSGRLPKAETPVRRGEERRQPTPGVTPRHMWTRLGTCREPSENLRGSA